ERISRLELRSRKAAEYDCFLRVRASHESQIRYFDRVVTSYFVDGLSNDLARSQAEVFSIQHAFPGYQTEEGHLTRIAEYQRNLTHYRIELQKAEGRLKEANRRPTVTVPLRRRLASAALAHSPHWLANYARALRSRGWLDWVR